MMSCNGEQFNNAVSVWFSCSTARGVHCEIALSIISTIKCEWDSSTESALNANAAQHICGARKMQRKWRVVKQPLQRPENIPRRRRQNSE